MYRHYFLIFIIISLQTLNDSELAEKEEDQNPLLIGSSEFGAGQGSRQHRSVIALADGNLNFSGIHRLMREPYLNKELKASIHPVCYDPGKVELAINTFEEAKLTHDKKI
ncbi:MAG TPA: hypothetical protein VJ876_02545 [Bacteroidales bacterium]|nr:hypothetical protein [Bacteroidales bacterium]